MRLISLALLATCLLFASSCKKSHDYGPGVGEYVKLKPGNYWIYESFQVDSTGYGVPGSFIPGEIYYDSVFVEKDTVIGAYTYHKLMEPADLGNTREFIAHYMRDSLAYEVAYGEGIVLAPYDYTTVFAREVIPGMPITRDSAVELKKLMTDKDYVVNTPAGNFTTAAFSQQWTFLPYAAQQAAITMRMMSTRYAVGVGMVSQDLPFFVSIPITVQRRLVRYHVQ